MALRRVADAYSASGRAWESGPARVYDRLAEILVDRSPLPLTGGRVVDIGAGTGAATRAALAAGAGGVVAVDAAFGMAAHQAHARPPAVVADALALPMAASSFDAAIAAFSLNHLREPVIGLREMARVTRPGGAVLASVYAADDTHPVKGAVEAALRSRGWVPEPWYLSLVTEVVPLLATPEAFVEAGRTAGFDATVDVARVPFPEMDGRDLVAWRLGLAQNAPFVAGLGRDARDAVEREALDRLGDAPPLERSILVLTAISP